MRVIYTMPQEPTNKNPTVSQTPNSTINPQNCIQKEHSTSFACSRFEFHFDSFVLSAKARSFYVCFQLPEVLREMKIEQQHFFHFLLWLTYFLSILYSINSERINRITVKGRRCFLSTCILKMTKFSFKEHLLHFICTSFIDVDILNIWHVLS